MTTAEMLFGSGDLAPSNAAWGRVLGIARQTVGEKIRNPSLRRKRQGEEGGKMAKKAAKSISTEKIKNVLKNRHDEIATLVGNALEMGKQIGRAQAIADAKREAEDSDQPTEKKAG